MAEPDEIRQPEHVSKPLDDYLTMTTPRRKAPRKKSPRRDERVAPPRPPIDNRGLSLEDGNDFA
jgi:hypothetical protein